MNRRPADLEGRPFDVAIVGGGITGACLAFDAASRGMAVALIERDDFGAATSAASSKLLHGGLRYLQQFKLAKVRESALERIAFQNLAPHLTRYVPFVVPTYRGVAKGRTLLSAGMLMYEALCLGQNRLLRDRGRRVPSGRSLTAAEVCSMVPGVRSVGLTGGRLFYESHMHSSERMTLAFIDSAARRGAVVANYVEAVDFATRDDRVVGINARDRLDDADLRIDARLVLNAAGPWIGRLNGSVGGRSLTGVVTGFSKGAHIVTKPLTDGYAVALPTNRPSQSVVDRGGRHVFVIPWRGHSLIGTTYGPYQGDLREVRATRADVEELIGDINAALGPGTLTRGDVRYAYAGLYPLTADEIDPEVYQGTGDYQILDHGELDGIPGLFSVFGAKYTTARLLAERALDRVAEQLGGGFAPCQTAGLALAAGDLANVDGYWRAKLAELAGRVPAGVTEQLVTYYGATLDEVVTLMDERPELAQPLAEGSDVLGAQVVHAVRQEMACHLDDFVFRRTGLGTLGCPGADVLHRAATIMAGELGWDPPTLAAEEARVRERFEL